jgi:hypothetical protein
MNSITRALAILLLASASRAVASTDTACWNRNTERLDFMLKPAEKGDNGFFTAVSNGNDSVNVTLLYPAKSSMRHFVRKLYDIRQSGTGCANTYLSSLPYFINSTVTPPRPSPALEGVYSPSKTYPDPGPLYSGGGGQSDGLTAGRAYRYLNWGANGDPVPRRWRRPSPLRASTQVAPRKRQRAVRAWPPGATG